MPGLRFGFLANALLAAWFYFVKSMSECLWMMEIASLLNISLK